MMRRCQSELFRRGLVVRGSECCAVVMALGRGFLGGVRGLSPANASVCTRLYSASAGDRPQFQLKRFSLTVSGWLYLRKQRDELGGAGGELWLTECQACNSPPKSLSTVLQSVATWGVRGV